MSTIPSPTTSIFNLTVKTLIPNFLHSFFSFSNPSLSVFFSSTNSMDDILETAGKQVLVDVVKLVQKRGMEGTSGSWKEFLTNFDKRFGSSISDPRKRSNEVLVAFLKTFTNKDDLKFLSKVIQCHLNRETVEQSTKTSSESESPEQRLVRLTLEHPQYPAQYSFPSHEEGWIVMKLKNKPKVMKSTTMIAVDCEMVLCDDGTEALVKVCVVDRNLQVKLNEYVNPNKVVADYRTEITGIAAKDLEGVTCSLEDIQNSMKKLLSRGTILVGHSLNNDLEAMKIDHARVIDTSFIFKYSGGLSHRRPSLNNLCKSVLGYEVRKKGAPHNCLDDACAAMKLVLASIEKGVNSEIDFVHEDVPDVEMAKLLIHRIPINVPSKELHNIIPGNFVIELKPTKKAQAENYSALAIFKNSHHARQAFEKIEGILEKDTSGRPQKLVTCNLSTGVANLYVRKMVSDEAEVLSKKRALQQVEDSGKAKKRKANEQTEEVDEVTDSDKCNDHSKENELSQTDTKLCNEHLKVIEEQAQQIESLKAEVKSKDHEIDALNKMVLNLKKKQQLKQKR